MSTRIGLDWIVNGAGRYYVLEVNPEPDITLDHYEFPDAIADYLSRTAGQDSAGVPHAG